MRRISKAVLGCKRECACRVRKNLDAYLYLFETEAKITDASEEEFSLARREQSLNVVDKPFKYFDCFNQNVGRR